MAHRNLRARLTARFGTLLIASAAAVPLAQSEKYASIVVDADSLEVVHESFADAERYPASLTKVMTLYMVFEALKSGELRLDERLPVSRNASRQPPSKLGLKPGQTISTGDAIKSLVTKSANDVAVVVAERLGGSEERFAALMTVKARMLGLSRTSFYNASGLPDDRQTTTARDMAVLADAMMEDHPEYYSYFSTQRFTWKGRTYKNHNALLKDVEGVDGMKTGYIRASGFNLMTSVERDETRFIVIVLGGKSSRARNDHVTDLIEAAYYNLGTPDAGGPRRLAVKIIDGMNDQPMDTAAIAQGAASR